MNLTAKSIDGTGLIPEIHFMVYLEGVFPNLFTYEARYYLNANEENIIKAYHLNPLDFSYLADANDKADFYRMNMLGYAMGIVVNLPKELSVKILLEAKLNLNILCKNPWKSYPAECGLMNIFNMDIEYWLQMTFIFLKRFYKDEIPHKLKDDKSITWRLIFSGVCKCLEFMCENMVMNGHDSLLQSSIACNNVPVMKLFLSLFPLEINKFYINKVCDYGADYVFDYIMDNYPNVMNESITYESSYLIISSIKSESVHIAKSLLNHALFRLKDSIKSECLEILRTYMEIDMFELLLGHSNLLGNASMEELLREVSLFSVSRIVKRNDKSVEDVISNKLNLITHLNNKYFAFHKEEYIVTSLVICAKYGFIEGMNLILSFPSVKDKIEELVENGIYSDILHAACESILYSKDITIGWKEFMNQRKIYIINVFSKLAPNVCADVFNTHIYNDGGKAFMSVMYSIVKGIIRDGRHKTFDDTELNNARWELAEFNCNVIEGFGVNIATSNFNTRFIMSSTVIR